MYEKLYKKTPKTPQFRFLKCQHVMSFTTVLQIYTFFYLFFLFFFKETGHFIIIFFFVFFFPQHMIHLESFRSLLIPTSVFMPSIQSYLLILSIYIIKCMQIPLPLSRNFKYLIKMFDSMSSTFCFCLSRVGPKACYKVSLFLENTLRLVWHGYLQHAIPA